MGYFEFLHGSRIICLPLNISEKLHQQNVFQKLEKTETHRLHLNYNTLQYPCNTLTLQYPCTLKNNIYHSNKHGPPPFFHLDTNPVIGHALAHYVDKTHVLVVTVDFIWLLFLNILSFNFVATPRKFLRFTRVIRSYLNRPAVVLTSHYQSFTAFLLDVRFSKLSYSILQLFFPSDSVFALLSTPVAQMLRTSR